MRFMFLMYGDESAEAALTADERGAIVRGHVELGRQLRASGALVLAVGDYRRALDRCANDVERAFLATRLADALAARPRGA